MASSQRVVLAYSGGLDTSIILRWLIDQGYEVIAFIADVGQEEDFEAARKKAFDLGAAEVVVEDLQEELVEHFIYPAIRGNALYEGRYLLGTAVARPLIARAQIDAARRYQAAYVSHGATGKGNDQVRFELAYYALAPDIQVLAPWKMPAFMQYFQGRADMLAYAEEKGIPISSSPAKPYSEDDNLLHISHEAGVLEDPGQACEASVYSRTTDPQRAPEKPERVRLVFEAGRPVALQRDAAAEERPACASAMMHRLNELAARHGIGRLDMVENRFVGIKSRGVYETPGGALLYEAYRDLEGLVMDREVLRLRNDLGRRMADSIYNGFWFAPEMNVLLAATETATRHLAGWVELELYKGRAYPVARGSHWALYDAQQSSMDETGDYNPIHADGLIRLQALRLQAWQRLHGSRGSARTEATGGRPD